MFSEPTPQHGWLNKLVGQWSYEVEAPATTPGEAPTRLAGTENIRAIGPLWIVAEGQGEMPGGGTATTLLTIGYDAKKSHFVGTWIGSMMDHLWVYTGELDETSGTLSLHTEGPDFEVEGATAKYKEVITLNSDDERTFQSFVQRGDGQWQNIMTAHYRRAR
jgi:hypothetical protein